MATLAHATRSDPAVLSLIGNTPLVEITRLDVGRCRLFVKLESQNPGGSIKDRIALSMIAAAEAEGLAGMIDAEDVQQSCMQIVNLTDALVAMLLDNFRRELI